MEIDSKTGSIENVATNSNYRKKGIATSLNGIHFRIKYV